MNLTNQVHQILSQYLKPGDCAVDMTAGNGWDTLFLSKAVEEKGQVFSFDIQNQAIEKTDARIKKNIPSKNYTLINSCHTEFEQKIPRIFYQKIKAITFNLGYLPHSNKEIITKPDSSRYAADKSYQWLAEDGVMTIITYQGHSGGVEETETVLHWAQNVPTYNKVIRGNDSAESPLLVVIKKSKGAD
jgi:predicted methyltransferase